MAELSYLTEGAVLHLKGEWLIEHYASAPTRDSLEHITTIDGSDVTHIDTYGAILLRRMVGEDVQFVHMDDDHEHFIRTVWDEDIADVAHPASLSVIARIGRYSVYIWQELCGILAFAGRVFIALARVTRHPSKFRFKAWVRHMDEAGVQAIFIVTMLAFLISIVLAYQGATQLRLFGAAIYTIDLTVISIMREMGVLLTAIMVAGRSGSAFAAEIGVMKLREEIDALKTIGINPFNLLVVPRILALVVMMPALTFLADIAGLIGTFTITHILLDVSLHQFIERCSSQIGPNTFLVGMVKAPIFGFLIGLIGTYQGMQVSGSAESVGRLTTISVVQSIFLVIFADALFSILFSTFKL